MVTKTAAVPRTSRKEAVLDIASTPVATMRRRRTVMDEGHQAREGCGYKQNRTLALVSSVANAGVVVVSAMVAVSALAPMAVDGAIKDL